MKGKRRKIAIVGAGPGGLTLARLLQLQGADVTVYERDPHKDARVQGSPLDMHEGSGLAALQHAGLMDAYARNVYRDADKKLIVNERAEVIFSDHKEHDRAPNRRYEIDRKTLRKIVLESLQPESVIWDSHFIAMQPQHPG